MESQRELLRMLKPKTKVSENDENEQVPENETRNFYTPTKITTLTYVVTIWLHATPWK